MFCIASSGQGYQIKNYSFYSSKSNNTYVVLNLIFLIGIFLLIFEININHNSIETSKKMLRAPTLSLGFSKDCQFR